MGESKEKRLRFKCWQCGREYTLLRDLGELQPKLVVECPFCEQVGVVDLSPYRSPVVSIYADKDAVGQPLAETYMLPDVLPTAEPTP